MKGRLDHPHLAKQWIDQQGGMANGKMRWATVEHGPEQGRRKRKILGEAAKARKVLLVACDLPHKTSKERTDEALPLMAHIERIVVGDFDFTPTENQVWLLWGCTDADLPEQFKGQWSMTQNTRDI